MKRFCTLALAVMFVQVLSAYAGDKLLVAGSGWNKVAIVDKDTKKVEWSYEFDGECNNVIQTKKGNIVFGYSKGAKMINKQGDVLWDFKAKRGEELFTVIELKKGYLVAMCGNPARIIELSEKGEVVSELKYDTGIGVPHAQFRQVKLSKKGTYLIPLFNGEIREIDKTGKLLRSIKVGGDLFSVVELPNGNWLIPCGDSGSFVELNPDTEQVVKRLNKTDIEGVKLAFVAELVRFKNGNTLISNWLGHITDRSQPLLIEIDANGKEVWRLDSDPDTGMAISAVFPLYGKFYR